MSEDLTVNAYDRIAEAFNRKRDLLFWQKELGIFKRLVPGKKVIDLGCGTGQDAQLLVDAGFDYTGIDASQAMLDLAKGRVAGAKFIKMDLYDLQFPVESFDGFWAAASLLHIPKSKINEVLQSIRRITKQQGVGFISLKEKKQMDEGWIEQNISGIKVKRYWAFYSPEEFIGRLRKNGFKTLSWHRNTEKDGTVWLCFFVQKQEI